MSQVENQWVAKRDRLLIVGLIASQRFKETLIPVERSMKVDPYLFSSRRGVTTIKGWHSLRKKLSHINFYWILAGCKTTCRISVRVMRYSQRILGYFDKIKYAKNKIIYMIYSAYI